MQSNSDNSLSKDLFEFNEELTNIIDAIHSALESGHGMMLDAFKDSLKEYILSRPERVDEVIALIEYDKARIQKLSLDMWDLQMKASKLEREYKTINQVVQVILKEQGVNVLRGTCDKRLELTKKSYVKVLNTDQIPVDMIREVIQKDVDYGLVKRLLESGEVVPGAELGTSYAVEITK